MNECQQMEWFYQILENVQDISDDEERNNNSENKNMRLVSWSVLGAENTIETNSKADLQK